MAQRPVRFIIKQTSVIGRVPSGTTGNESNLIKQGELAVNTADQKLYSFDGTDVFELGASSFLKLSGGTVGSITVTGDSIFTGSLSASTFYSGTTDLDTIIRSIASGSTGGDLTRVQGGVNISTGGTANVPIINLDDDIALGSVNATTLSGDTIFSGITDLDSVIRTIANESELNDITRVGSGINTFTGGTAQLPTVNITGASLDNLYVSGVTEFSILSSTTISGGTLYSGDTNLYEIFSVTGHTHEISDVNNLIGSLNTKSNLSGSTFSGPISSPIISGDTLFSGSTDLDSVIRTIATESELNDITRVGNGINTFTGGTPQLPTVNITGASLDNLYVSGSNTSNSFSANTISGGTLFSGSTDLESIITSISNSSFTGATAVTLNSWVSFSGGGYYQDFYHGMNTLDVDVTVYDLGTNRNVFPDEIERLSVDNMRIYNASSGVTLRIVVQKTGGVGFTSGGTGDVIGPVSSIDNRLIRFDGTTGKVIQISPIESNDAGDISNIELLSANSITGNTVSGNTLFSGSTDLDSVIRTIASETEDFDLTRVQGGTNISTGGTANVPIINLDDDISLGSVNATTLSGDTLFSGSTDLDSVIRTIATESELNDITRVGNGINTFTGGTVQLPTVNITGASLDNLYVSGSNTSNSFSATTLSGDTLFSGSTDLDSVIRTIASETEELDLTRVQGGTNISTGGTANVPIINLDDDISLGSVNATTLSGDTIFSGITDLDSVIRTIATESELNDITRVGNGINTFTGGTAQLPTVNITGASLDNLYVSGSNTSNSFSATTLSGDTLFSGSTDLEIIMKNVANTSITGATAVTLNSWVSFSGGGFYQEFYHGMNTLDVDVTVYDLGTNRDVIVDEIERVGVDNMRIYSITSGVTLRAVIQKSGGAGFTSGGTGDLIGPASSFDNRIATFDGTTGKVIKVSPVSLDDSGNITNANSIDVSQVTSNTIGSSTISGDTLFSGSTNLDTIIRSIHSDVGGDQTRVQGGTNISTGGTVNEPIINLENDIVLGTIDATTLSGDTLFSGSTDLDSVIRTIASETEEVDLTRVQGGTNISTGGTANAPIINLDDDIVLGSVNATTLSGGTIYSADTNIEEIFIRREKKTFDFVFALSKNVSNNSEYFYSWVGTTSESIRSGNSAGMQNADTVSPIMAPFSGTVTGATMTVKGVGVQNGSVTYPVTVQTEMHLVGFTTEDDAATSSPFNIDIDIDSSFTVGTFSPGATNARGLKTTGLSIGINQGDMVALEFINGNSASLAGQIRNLFVTLHAVED